jgi:hypothetical protein
MWDTFQSAQQAAFNDVDDWLTSLYHYFDLAGSDPEQAEEYWQDSLDALDHLDNVTAAPVDPTLEALLGRLESSATLLEQVQELDQANTLLVACPTGNVQFELPAQPFIFWKDEEGPEYDSWMPFTFPELAVHQTGQCQPYYSATSGGFIEWLEGLEHIDFIEWLLEHKDEGPDMNAAAATVFDFLCANCGSPVVYSIEDECFTQELLDDFCETEKDKDGTGDCYKSLSDLKKNETIAEKFRCYTQEQLLHIAGVVRDYVCPTWLPYFEWLE